mgnify:CR=1 FL=1
MIRSFKRFGGWPDEVIEKFIVNSNNNTFVMLPEDVVVSGETLSVSLDDMTESPRLMEIAAIARDLGGIIVTEE